MSFEHKYLKYKQKYLELKQELQGLQTGGAFFDSESSDALNIEKLTETPTLESSNILQTGGFQNLEDSEKSSEKIIESDNEDDISLEKLSSDSSDLEEDNEQEGGDLDTSISELDEIFSQLGGKKKDSSSSESDSDLESLSSLDSSSDEDLLDEDL